MAASDNHLWQLMHINFFGRPSDNPNIIRLTYGVERITFTPGNTTTASVDWRDAFKRAYRGIPIGCYPTLIRQNNIPAMFHCFYPCCVSL